MKIEQKIEIDETKALIQYWVRRRSEINVYIFRDEITSINKRIDHLNDKYKKLQATEPTK